MRRQVVALAVCAALGVTLLPAAALAGGRVFPQRGLGAHGARPAHGAVKAIPELHPRSAFGSPGGFPLVAWDRHPRQIAGVRSGHLAHRFPRHAFVHRFPSTVFLYTPAALYGPPVDTPAPVVTVSPVTYVSPTIYVSPTVVLPDPTPAAASPPVPRLPQVVEYPTGRYELRGDGAAIPYVWVWIPNPPAGPPAPASPAADEPPAVPGRQGETYRWTDEEGTTFWTNRLDKVPEAFRPRAQGPA